MSIINWLIGAEPGIIDKIKFMITHDFDKGAYGEYLTTYMFGNDNIEGYSKTLNNIYIPYKGKTSEIDVLLINEKGIIVIESKNYSGWIFGSAEQPYWTQTLNSKTKNRFYNPIKQNRTHIKALSQYLGVDQQLMKSYIVFSERCELKKVPNDTAEYTILRRHHLLKRLKKDLAICSNVLTVHDIDLLTDRLMPLTNVSDTVKQNHIDNIKSKYK